MWFTILIIFIIIFNIDILRAFITRILTRLPPLPLVIISLDTDVSSAEQLHLKNRLQWKIETDQFNWWKIAVRNLPPYLRTWWWLVDPYCVGHSYRKLIHRLVLKGHLISSFHRQALAWVLWILTEYLLLMGVEISDEIHRFIISQAIWRDTVIYKSEGVNV